MRPIVMQWLRSLFARLAAGGSWLQQLGRRFWFRRLIGLCGGGLVVAVIVWCVALRTMPLPERFLTAPPVSPQVLDRDGQPLLRLTSRDGHWHFPVTLEEISPQVTAATLAVEDNQFHQHQGVHYLALCRAAIQNVVYRRFYSGASTITMQLTRIRGGRSRTILGKLQQMFRAEQYELQYSKSEILTAYLNEAPYGGNLRGIAAAARYYFNKHARDLTLAEAALLAGIPQSPARLRPDRHLPEAIRRQQFVLWRMWQLGWISAAEYRQAYYQKIKLSTESEQVLASHAAWYALRQRPLGGQITLDANLQRVVNGLVREHRSRLPEGANCAVVVIDIPRGELLAMVGSVDEKHPDYGQVNGAIALRSPGSALKPFLYATAFQEHRLAPEFLLADTPLERAGWAPDNFDDTFSGQVTATEALRRSLNIPAVTIAERLGLPKCVGVLRSLGLPLHDGVERRGGLTLAVGGVEVSLLDLTNAYATIGRGGHYLPLRMWHEKTSPKSTGHVVFEPGVCDLLDEILGSHQRSLAGWEKGLRNQMWCAWKTGTSSGRRDAWAVGHNRRFAIGVWVGNFTGAGNVEFVGQQAAEPVLAQLFAAPELRHQYTPKPPQAWSVDDPLIHPVTTQTPVKIIRPAANDTYMAVQGKAIIQPAIAPRCEVSWFLNGRFLSTSLAEKLELDPGRYELRCVSAGGQTVAVNFNVR